jgi:hypothetical protein
VGGVGAAQLVRPGEPVVVGKGAARAAASFYSVLSKDRFGGFTSLYWDGTCLTISRKHQCYKSHRYTLDTIPLNEKELAKLKEFLLYGDISDMQRLPR